MNIFLIAWGVKKKKKEKALPVLGQQRENYDHIYQWLIKLKERKIYLNEAGHNKSCIYGA